MLCLLAGPAMTSCALPELYVGCEGKPLTGVTAAELIGAYTGDPSGSRTLAVDGTLTVSDWMDDPDYTNGGKVFSMAPTTGTGAWNLEPDPFDKEWMEVAVKLDFQGGGGTNMPLHITGSRRQPVLHNILGDPDECDEMLLTKQS